MRDSAQSCNLLSTCALALNSRHIIVRSVRRRLSILSVLVVLSVGLVGCDSGGADQNSLSAEKAKQEVRNLDRTLSSDVANLTGGNAAKALRGLNKPVEVERNGSTVERPLGLVLVSALDRQDISPESTGEYSWDSSTASWVDEGTANGALILNVPTSPTAYANNANNATFTLAEYETTTVTLDGEPAEVPASVNVSITVESVGEIFSVDLSNTSFYDGQIDGSQMPKSVLLKVLTDPHFHTVQLDSPSKDQFNVAFDLEKEGEGGETVLGLRAEATLTDDFDTVADDVDVGAGIDELAGTIELGPDATIDYTIDGSGTAGLLADPSLEEINNQFSATVNVGGEKAGDIKFAETTQNGVTRIIPVIVYPNGDQEPLRQVFSGTVETLSGPSTGGIGEAITSMSRSVRNAVLRVVQ